MPAKKKSKYTVATLDTETDPFLHGRVPAPFCAGLRIGPDYVEFWGDDCIEQLIDYLRDYPKPLLIYAHNGGKFDFHFLFNYISNPVLIIKSRITEATLFHHKLRDSFAILPVPLRDYSKIEFDYNKMERHCRERHRDEILYYLKDDCDKLFELVDRFVARFGPRMTIGGAAMKELQALHPFEKQGARHDAEFRPFYFGGRVQCFKSGDLAGPWQYVDLNSSYPDTMRNKLHPINGAFDVSDKLPDNFDMPFFAIVEGENRGALPVKGGEGGLNFEQRSGLFHVCSHELEVALKWGLFDVHKVHRCYLAAEAISFAAYVDKFFAEKVAAEEIGDPIMRLFAKLFLNSGYGRFGINPENFEDWYINRDFGADFELEEQGYSLAVDYDALEMWNRKTEITERNYCDVAVAASITSGSRATLLDGLQQAVEPIYCDTDSIICRGFNGPMHKTRLGAWDLEKSATHAAIGGQKLYALYDKAPGQPDKLVKLSSKGGSLSLSEIQAICRGDRVRYENMAPTFSLRRPPTFIHRNFTKTVAEPEIEEYA